MISQFEIATVALCGPLAEPRAPASGGYETANARLLEICENAGWRTERLTYPTVKSRIPLVKLVAYLWTFRGIARRIYCFQPATIIHFTPLCRHFLPSELGLVAWASRRKHHVVIDLRAGTKDLDYASRSSVYRILFRHLIACADAVAVEGERYLDFVRGLRPDVPAYYLPNFLPDADIPDTAPRREPGPIRFAYVGSVNEAKGLLHATQLVAALAAGGAAVRFDVFGKAEPAFAEQLQTIAAGADWFVLHGPQPYETIRMTLSEAHFFLFLTAWRGEGHSNALTEAMSQGAIPVVTDHGFCADVAGPDAIVVADRTETAGIAAEVKALCGEPTEMAARSERLVARVRERYSETAVAATLSAIYSGRP